MEDKIKVYVCSLKGISTLDYVDTESIGHPCVTSRHGDDVLSGLKHVPTGSRHAYFTSNQIKILDLVDEFCEERGLEYEIVDVTNMNFAAKMRLVFKGIKAPTISYKGKRIEGTLTKGALEALIAQ